MKLPVTKLLFIFCLFLHFPLFIIAENIQELFFKGNAFFNVKQYIDAIKCYRKALAINNQLSSIHFNLALAYTKICEWHKAISHFTIFLNYEPDNINALYQLAHTLKESQNPQKAIKIYQKIIEFAPDYKQAHFGLGLCHLMLEDFSNGWPSFERGSATYEQFPTYNWKDAHLAGKIILIRAHWGFGDMIQFVRYAQLLHQRGAVVILQTYPELIPLLSCCPFLDKIISTADPLPAHDMQIPLMSLMHAFNVTINDIPQLPYIFANSFLIKEWGEKLTAIEKHEKHRPFRIGICWSGRGTEEIPLKLRKNIPLSLLAPLAELKNSKLYSLQKINDTNQLSDISFPVHQFKPTFDHQHGRFMDTAAVMQHLDLVITVDTSIAHLAGALGVPVWIMLPWTADWRWFMKRTDSPWYQTARLFRQSKPGKWKPVIREIKKELQKIMSR